MEAAGAETYVVEIEPRVRYASENALSFEVQRCIAEAVADARSAGRFPLILAGNCNAAVGGVSGIGRSRRGVVWFDAHGDFCTPETTDTGFLDGMGLAMMVGRCWRQVLSYSPGYSPVAETATALVGARDLDPLEAEELTESAITYLRVANIRLNGVEDAFKPFLQRLMLEVDHVYIHIDLDVHDPEEAPANRLNVPDGLWAKEVREAVTFIGKHVQIAGGGFGSYDPSVDPDGKTAKVAVALLKTLLEASSTNSSISH